jgi:hypothetical protein
MLREGMPVVWCARAMRQVLLTFGSAICALLWGCADHGPRTVSNPDLEEKIPAIEDASRHHDLSAAPQLVKDLDSDDPAVRFYSIRGLCSLTGETRKPAVARWKHWLGEQQK